MLSSLKCTEEMKDITIEDVHYKCEISHKLVRQLLNQQDPEVVKMVEKYFPLGISEAKRKEGNKSVCNDDCAVDTETADELKNLSFQSNLLSDRTATFFYGADNGQFSVAQLPLPLPPMYSSYPLYPVESGTFENRFANYPPYVSLPMGIGVDSSDCETMPILPDGSHSKGDSDSGDSATTNVFSYRDLSSAVSYPYSSSAWPPRPPQDSIYSPSLWPINNVLYPYLSVPVNTAFASVPYVMPSFPAHLFQDNQFSVPTAFPPFFIASQSKISKAK